MFAQPAPGRTGKGHRVRVQTQFTLVLNIPASPRLPEPSLPAEGQEEAAPCPGLHVSCKQQTAPSPLSPSCLSGGSGVARASLQV